MCDFLKIADDADIIVNGYAFTKCKNNVRVLNLNNPKRASVIDASGEVIETSMDDIEIQIMLEYYHKNQMILEEMYA